MIIHIPVTSFSDVFIECSFSMNRILTGCMCDHVVWKVMILNVPQHSVALHTHISFCQKSYSHCRLAADRIVWMAVMILSFRLWSLMGLVTYTLSLPVVHLEQIPMVWDWRSGDLEYVHSNQPVSCEVKKMPPDLVLDRILSMPLLCTLPAMLIEQQYSQCVMCR
jgi:hypothetical protein